MNIHDAHKTGIGGSGAAALFGEGFRSVHALYAECCGLAPESKSCLAFDIGRHNEPFIRTWYEKKIGMAGAPTETMCKSEMPWMIGHLDWLSTDRTRFAEFKVAGLHTAKEWGDPKHSQVPLGYYLQGLHYAIITGIDAWDLAVMLGTEIRVYPCVRDEDLAKELIEREAHFWNEHVLKRIPPPVDGTKDCARLIAWLHPNSADAMEWAEGETARLLNLFAEVKRNRDAEQANYDELENKIKAAIGDREGLQTPDIKITWKRNAKGARVFLPKLTSDAEGVAA